MRLLMVKRKINSNLPDKSFWFRQDRLILYDMHVVFRRIWVIGLFVSSLTGGYSQVHLNFMTLANSSSWSEEVSGSNKPMHQGYSAGFDVVIQDGLLIMPGLHYQSTSLFPVTIDWNNPFRKNIDIKSIKLPLQIGFFILKHKSIDLRIHGGIAGTYLIDVAKNSKVLEEDLRGIRTGLLLGTSFRILFMTVHAGFEHGLSKIFHENNPSGIVNGSKEKIFSTGIGVYL